MGFSFNGITSKEMGIPTRMSIENRIPGIRNLTDTIAGRHGVFDFGETLSERQIEISCFIPPGKSDAELLALKDKIVEWLNPDKGLCPLVLDTEPGRMYMARLEDGLSFERMIRNTGTFELAFFCPDPFAYAIEDEIFTLAQNETIKRVLGNTQSHPVYEIRGMLTDEGQSLSFTINKEQMVIKGPLLEGEVLYVDTDDMTAKIIAADGTEKNALSYMAAFEFPYLNMGENEIAIGAENGTLASFTIRAKSRWL